MRLVSYYPTWSIYGRNYFFENVPFDYLTDLTLAFAVPKPDGTLNLDEMNNLDMTELRELCVGRKFRIGISVGGWGTCEEFATATETEERRNRLIESCLDLIQKYELNYLEIDWEYPADQIQTHNLMLLLKGISERIYPSIQLSICVPCFQSGFVTTELNSYVDFVVLMGFDMSGAWSEQSGHHSALIPNIQNHVRYLNQNERVPMSKIVLGCPLYARTFAECRGLNEAFSGPGIGSFGEKGSMDYKDVIKYCKNRIMYDDHTVSHYASFEGNFMTFEGPQSMETKCNWAREQGLGGLAFWQVAGDASASDSLIKIASNIINTHK